MIFQDQITDHYAIEFYIKLQVDCRSTQYWNVRKTDLEGYGSDLKTNVQFIDSELDREELAAERLGYRVCYNLWLSEIL